jgi:glyoxylase-like metal-dependent hydrolase (beta-lactamase superfamily II)
VSELHVRTFLSPAFAQNGYVVWRDGGSAVAIDPGSAANEMADFIASEGLWCEAILLTHAHIDHIEGVGTLVGRTGAATYMHPRDRELYDRVEEQGMMLGYKVDRQPPIDHDLEHGQKLDFGGTRFDVIYVPGHAPGHVMFHDPENSKAFSGDVIFAGSIGRTDLPGGNLERLMTSIRTHVLALPDDTTIYSGHGPETTVGNERMTNPFLIGNYGGGFA